MCKLNKRVSKIVVAGDGGIGKTTLLKKFCYNQYSAKERLTAGCEVFVKEARVNKKAELFQIWDLGGQEQFRFFLKDFFRGMKGAIVGFDIKRRKSFQDLEEWVEMLRDYDAYLPIVLIGTKIDLGYHPTLNPNLANQFVDDFSLLKFVEISTKENYNVNEPFKILIEHILKTKEEMIEFQPFKIETNKVVQIN